MAEGPYETSGDGDRGDKEEATNTQFGIESEDIDDLQGENLSNVNDNLSSIAGEDYFWDDKQDEANDYVSQCTEARLFGAFEFLKDEHALNGSSDDGKLSLANAGLRKDKGILGWTNVASGLLPEYDLSRYDFSAKFCTWTPPPTPPEEDKPKAAKGARSKKQPKAGETGDAPEKQLKAGGTSKTPRKKRASPRSIVVNLPEVIDFLAVCGQEGEYLPMEYLHMNYLPIGVQSPIDICVIIKPQAGLIPLGRPSEGTDAAKAGEQIVFTGSLHILQGKPHRLVPKYFITGRTRAAGKFVMSMQECREYPFEIEKGFTRHTMSTMQVKTRTNFDLWLRHLEGQRSKLEGLLGELSDIRTKMWIDAGELAASQKISMAQAVEYANLKGVSQLVLEAVRPMSLARFYRLVQNFLTVETTSTLENVLGGFDAYNTSLEDPGDFSMKNLVSFAEGNVVASLPRVFIVDKAAKTVVLTAGIDEELRKLALEAVKTRKVRRVATRGSEGQKRELNAEDAGEEEAAKPAKRQKKRKGEKGKGATATGKIESISKSGEAKTAETNGKNEKSKASEQTAAGDASDEEDTGLHTPPPSAKKPVDVATFILENPDGLSPGGEERVIALQKELEEDVDGDAQKDAVRKEKLARSNKVKADKLKLAEERKKQKENEKLLVEQLRAKAKEKKEKVAKENRRMARLELFMDSHSESDWAEFDADMTSEDERWETSLNKRMQDRIDHNNQGDASTFGGNGAHQA